jgi:hypothetical protein
MLATRCGSISITANEAVRQLVYIHTVDMASSSLLLANADILGFGSCSDRKCLSAESCKNLDVPGSPNQGPISIGWPLHLTN